MPDKVMLRHKGTGLYHTGWQSWSAVRDVATDFGSVDRAMQRARQEGLDKVEVVVMHKGNQPDDVIQIPQKPTP